jgi:hypothetical protein
VRDIMRDVPPEQRVLASADQEEAANAVAKYDLVVIPVLDELGHLLGVITHDDAMEIVQEESTEDIERIAGISGEGSEENYLLTSVFSHFRRRFLWLLALAMLAIASGYVMLRFEDTPWQSPPSRSSCCRHSDRRCPRESRSGCSAPRWRSPWPPKSPPPPWWAPCCRSAPAP